MVVSTVSVAFGATMLAFSVVNGAVLKPVGPGDMDRLVNVEVSSPDNA
jgi:hypothetical protein